MSRPLRIVVLALTIVSFVAISIGLARVLSANTTERSRIVALLEAQARGEADAMVARIHGCSASARCRSLAAANATRLRSSGKLEIARLDPSTSFSLGGSTDVARVVWKTPARITVVQCIQVHRGGSVLHGLTVELHSLSRPIARTSSCPSAS